MRRAARSTIRTLATRTCGAGTTTDPPIGTTCASLHRPRHARRRGSARRTNGTVLIRSPQTVLPATDRAEVAELYRKYGYFVLRRCALLVRDRAAAEDVTHDVFVKLLRGAQQPTDLKSPLAFLYRVAENACFDHLRRRKSRPTEPIDLEGLAVCHPAVGVEDRDAVLGVLGELDERDIRICVMTFVDGMTQEQVARELSLSRNTVNKRVQFIRERASRLLGRETEKRS
jgi:RNA polymerase sigma-70 factor (ECF subfamily)